MASLNVQEKVQELKQLLASAKNSATEIMNGELATQLFEQAPAEFLAQKNLTTLSELTLFCGDALQAFSDDSQTPIVQCLNQKDATYIAVALGDRPFIINTVVLILDQLKLNVRVFLHPILSIPSGRRVSLSLIETEAVSSEKIELIKSQLVSALRDVMLVTDDFPGVLAQVQTSSRMLTQVVTVPGYSSGERKEASEFLRWIADGGFVFFGALRWKASSKDGSPMSAELLGQKPEQSSGIFRSQNQFSSVLLNEVRSDINTLLASGELFTYAKLQLLSTIHRHERLDHIAIREFGSDGALTGVLSIVGLLTFEALRQPSSSIPVIRQKLQKLIEADGLVPNSFDYKAVFNVIDGMPREMIFIFDSEELRDSIHLVSNLHRGSETVARVRYDKAGRGVSIVVMMGYDRFSEQVKNKIQQYLEQVFGVAGGSSEYRLAQTARPVALMYFHVPLKDAQAHNVAVEKIEREIIESTKSWVDRMRELIMQSTQVPNRDELWSLYQNAFPANYQASNDPNTAINDILHLQKLSADHPMAIGMTAGSGNAFFNLTLYSLHEATLSQALPVLENVGLLVLKEDSTRVQTSQPKFIHRFAVKPKESMYVDLNALGSNLAPGLVDIFSTAVENDSLNALLLHADLDTRSISLLRAYCQYMWQITKFASREVIMRTLASTPNAAALLWNMFEIKFNPGFGSSIDSRQQRFSAALLAYKDNLRNVPDITQDRILRVLANILEATVRTNFYEALPFISFKIRSEAVEIMGRPKPYFEIFVSSPRVEGIHLRGGMVARGGLRWSERKEDYRQEVLGLMKTQIVKNALIVPTGAKGGFIVKIPPSDPKDMPQTVEDCYREFIRALLTLADNRVAEEILHPKGLVIYDNADPYFVVAADKGTAKFSDVANQIATKEFNFWLGDAFASGGSNGYDHKLYAITARGTWECVNRHFSDLSIDQTKPFRVIGIGDMSGDVFGNGLLGSRQIKLIAAFNHEHIFIDPDPNTEKSFTERERLFNLPRSKWSDYQKKFISPGGGIFGRLDKEIKITPEMRKALSIADSVPESVNGEQLISLILKAECELLWNGGIGTYVKAQSETHATVNDGTNDGVRIDAKELRARVVGEGGNLGLTQLARIEYDQNGGRCNADAIDNSGGVDLSDHEVNYKLLFQRLVRNGKLTAEERNKILKEMAEEACQMVLRDNYSQALLLSLAVARSVRRMDNFKNLIRDLSRKGYVDRALSYLPDDEELGKRANRKLPLTRPEMAVLVSAVKMWLKDQLRESDYISDELLQNFLLSYFPAALRSKYQNEIFDHPLSKEIIITQIVNSVVDVAGVTFIHRTALNLSLPAKAVVKNYLAAAFLLGVEEIRVELRRLDGKIVNKHFLDFLQILNRAIGELTVWLVNHHEVGMPLGQLVQLYQAPFTELAGRIEQILPATLAAEFKNKQELCKSQGVSDEIARKLALSGVLLPIFGILWSVRSSGKTLAQVAPLYFAIIEDLGIRRVLEREPLIETNNQWESELLFTSLTDIRRGISKLVTASLDLPLASVSASLDSKPETARLKHFIRELRDQVPAVTAVAVIARQIRLCVD